MKKERAMSCYRIVCVVGILLFSMFASGCTCNIEVTRPPADGENIPPAYSFKSEITGTCSSDCEMDSFKADLDSQDITNLFTCAYGECEASIAVSQSGGHTLKVAANLSSSSYMCRVGKESDGRQFNVVIEGKETLSRPSVESPLYECATALTVSGFVPGAKIEIFADGSLLIGGGIADYPAGARFPVNPPLVSGQKITATQTYAGVTSPPSDEVVVESYFASHPEGLPKPTLRTPIHDCGGAIAVHNLVSGGFLEVFADSNRVGMVNGCGHGQAVGINPPFVTGQKVFATEKLCDYKSPESDHGEVIDAPTSLPAVTIGNIYEDGTMVDVNNITTGAMVRVYNGTQQIAGHYCSGGGQLFRLNPPPAVGDTLTAVQSLCDVKSDPSDPTTVKPCSELPAPSVGSVCAGEDYVIVSGAQPDARIRIYADGSLVGDGGGTRINLFHPVNGGEIIVATQQVGDCLSPLSSPIGVSTGLSKQSSLLTMRNGNMFFSPEAGEMAIDALVYTRGTGCSPYFSVKSSSAEQARIDIKDSLGRLVKTLPLQNNGGQWSGYWNWKSSQWSLIPDEIPVGEYSATLTVSNGANLTETMPFYVIFSPSEVSAPSEYSLSDKGEVGVWFAPSGSGQSSAIPYYLHPDDSRIFSQAIKLVKGQTDAYQASSIVMDWVVPQATDYCYGGPYPSSVTKRFVYSVCTHETDVLDLLARSDKLAQCADSANIFAALLRSVGIPAHPSTGDAAEEQGEIGWGFDTWTEVRLKGTEGEQWYVFHPHDPPDGYGPVTQLVFGTNHPWATKKVNDVVIMADNNWDALEITDYDYDISFGYGTPCHEPDQTFSHIKGWLRHLCLNSYYGMGYWGTGHWTCSPPRLSAIDIMIGKEAYRVGDTLYFDVVVNNLTEKPIKEGLTVSINRDNPLTKAYPDFILRKYDDSVNLEAGGSAKFRYEYKVPVDLASDHLYSVVVQAQNIKELRAVQDFKVLPLFDWELDIPRVLSGKEAGVLSLTVRNASDVHIEALQAALDVPRHLEVNSLSKTQISLGVGKEYTFKWDIKALSRSAVSQLVFSLSSENGGSIKIYKGILIK